MSLKRTGELWGEEMAQVILGWLVRREHGRCGVSISMRAEFFIQWNRDESSLIWS